MKSKRLITAVLLPAALLFTIALFSCLNPIGVDPNMKLNLEVEAKAVGEIGIDNINSAELRFINHTKSVDITDIEILISGNINGLNADNKLMFYSWGNSRIAGGPHAGTSEAILQRPTGQNSSMGVIVDGYKIVITTKKSNNDLSGLDTTGWQYTNTSNNGDFIGLIGNYSSASELDKWDTPTATTADFNAGSLLRGKQILHLFRAKDGSLKINTGDPETHDQDTLNPNDFISSVNINNGGTVINMDKMEVAVTSFPKIDVTIPGMDGWTDAIQNFSADISNAIGSLGLKLDAMTGAINSLAAVNQKGFVDLSTAMTASMTANTNILNASLTDIATAIRGGQKFQSGFGFVLVRNMTSKTINKAEFKSANKPEFDFNFGGIVSGDSIGKTLTANTSWTGEITIGNTTVKKTLQIFNQTVTYINVYEMKGGGFTFIYTEKDWYEINIPSDASEAYKDRAGRFEVWNYSNYELAAVKLVNRLDTNVTYATLDVGRGTTQMPAKVGSERAIPEGNYMVYIDLKDGTHVFEGLHTTINTAPNNNSDYNTIKIYQEHIDGQPQPKILYSVTANGGPPIESTEDDYQTTELTFEFDAGLPSNPVLSTISGPITGGSWDIRNGTSDPRLWTLLVTPSATGIFTFRITGQNVDETVHQVAVYKQNAPQVPSFVPVTDIVVLNGEDFVKGTGKQIISSVVPENATHKEVTWTIGTGDVINFNLFHHYGLGPNYDLNTSTSGFFKVNSSWGYDYWYVAAIIKNGRKEGPRSESYNSFSGVVVDRTGKQINITMQGIYYDSDKDFVKLFRFNQYTPPNVPSHIYMRFVNEDNGYNPGMTRLIFYKLDSNVNIGQSKHVMNGHPYGLDFWIYDGSGKHLTKEDKNLDNVMAKIRYPTNGKSGPSIVAAPYSQTYVKDLPVIPVDLAKYSTVHPMSDATAIVVNNSCVLEFDRPMNREKGTPHFVGLPSGLNIRINTLDGSKPANYLIAWIGSNQYHAQGETGATSDDQYKGYWPSSQTANSSRYWTRGGSPTEHHKWFILPATLRGMKSGDTITVYSKMWGIEY